MKNRITSQPIFSTTSLKFYLYLSFNELTFVLLGPINSFNKGNVLNAIITLIHSALTVNAWGILLIIAIYGYHHLLRVSLFRPLGHRGQDILTIPPQTMIAYLTTIQLTIPISALTGKLTSSSVATLNLETAQMMSGTYTVAIPNNTFYKNDVRIPVAPHPLIFTGLRTLYGLSPLQP